MKGFIPKLLSLIAMSNIMLTGLHTLCMERETSQFREEDNSTYKSIKAKYLNQLPLELRRSLVFSAVKENVDIFRCATLLSMGDSPKTLTCSFDGKTVLIAPSSDAEHRAFLYASETGELLQEFKEHAEAIHVLALSPDESIAFTAACNGKAYFWDVKKGQVLQTLKRPLADVRKAVFCPNSTTLLTISSLGGMVHFWSVETGELLPMELENTVNVRSAVYSPDGSIILTNGEKSCLWNSQTGELLQEIKDHSAFIFSPDGKSLLILAQGAARLLEITTGICLQELKKWPRHLSITAAAFSSDGRTILTGTSDEVVRIWDVKTGMLIQELKGHTKFIYKKGVFSNRLNNCCVYREIASYEPKTYRPWDEETEKLLQRLPVGQALIILVALSPDGMTLLTGDGSRTCLWNTKTGMLLQELKGYTGHIEIIEFSTDSATVIIGNTEEACFWNSKTGTLLEKRKTGPSRIRSVAFSADGNIITSRSEDGIIRTWKRFYWNAEMKELCMKYYPVLMNNVIDQSEGI